MPHLSKESIQKEYADMLFLELEKLIALTTQKNSSAVLQSLLTPTEKVMLAKRLAAALLFSKNYSQYQVWNLLKISPSTAQKMFLSYECGHYDALIKIATKQKDTNVWDILETILQAGLPSRGKDRWKFLPK